MSKLVDIRITDACANLNLVQDVLEKATKRKSDADALQKELRNLRKWDGPLTALDTLIYSCRQMLREDTTNSSLSKRVEEADRALKELRAQLENSCEQADKLARRWFNNDQLGLHKKTTVKLLGDKRRQIDRIRLEAPEGSPQKLLADIEDAKPLWGEHIETVAGVILRDEKLDGGLCGLADHLIENYHRHPPFMSANTLNILGHDHTFLRDLKYTVYFRFPTWSVWGLPLTAHEFWHASSSDLIVDPLWHRSFDKIPQSESKWSDPVVKDCLADAFATFVVGPSYAFACILLLLNVRLERDRVRANTIFETLKYLRQHDNEGTYEFASELQGSWTEAIAPLNSARSAALSYTGAQNDPSPPSVSTSRIDDEMLEALLNEFMPQVMRYDGTILGAAGETLSRLLGPECSEPEWKTESSNFLDDYPLIDLQHVLHAGWLGRWRSSVHDEPNIAMLSRKVEGLCRAIADRRNTTAPPTRDLDGSN